MRAALFAIVASMSLFGAGCHHNTCSNGCKGCCDQGGESGYDPGGMGAGHRHSGHGLAGGGHVGGGRFGHDHHARPGRGHHFGGRGPAHVPTLPHHFMQQQMYGQGGPQGPSVAYPYYTTRAPRDFLMANPPSIGP